MSQPELTAPISAFGTAVKAKFSVAGGEPEDNLRSPFESLLAAVGQELGVAGLVASGEHRLPDDHARPDYGVHVGGTLVGFVELKAPGKGADPHQFRGRDKEQWERLKCLPNVLYSDGKEFAVYSDGQRVGDVVRLVGSVETSGSALTPPEDGALAGLFRHFLGWQPITPRRPKQLADMTARLCRLLRSEVEVLIVTDPGLQALASDWRRLLFPELTDSQFADAYAQTVTFGLLLARVEGIDLAESGDLHGVAAQLGQKHTLVGRALDLLTAEQVLGKLAVSVGTLRRVLAVVDWAKISKGREAAWLYFYEEFLNVYDPALRKATGSYYTPVQVVDAMVSLVEEVLRTRLNHHEGFASDAVEVVDPCTGSGTYLLRIIERIAKQIEDEQGPGAVEGQLTAASKRIVGFELQAGPYSVAELRLAAEYAEHKVSLPSDGLRLYLADTLSDPFEEVQQLGSQYLQITESRKRANEVKQTDPVVVVIGNPPYREKSKGEGSWVEAGAPGAAAAPLADYIPPKDWRLGAHVKHLYNPYVYFWRWATWKVFDGHPSDRGVVAFITVAGFIAGPGFAKMRDYLRRTADAIWVIDCSPEGHQPEVVTRIFQAVQQPVCIVIAVRDGTTGPETPAPVRCTSVSGHRESKFEQLAALDLDADTWVDGLSDWQAPLLPAGPGSWQSLPTLDDLLAWSGSGTMPGRTWPSAPASAVLKRRWDALMAAPAEQKPALLDEHPTDRRVDTVLSDNLPGYESTDLSIGSEKRPCPDPTRYAFRSFDLQWIIPDKRLINRPNPGLWQVRDAPGQTYLTLLNRTSPTTGPAATAAACVPDIDHYRGSFGGRVYPLWLDSQGAQPNVVPGLLDALGAIYGHPVSGPDLFAYAASLLCSPAYTAGFSDELALPGLRLPITADAALFEEAVAVGKRVLWLHTFGERFADRGAGRPPGAPRPSAEHRPKVVVGIPGSKDGMPDTVGYDPDTKTLLVGVGRIAPVSAAVWDYEVSGMRVVKRWFDRRKRKPDGRRTSPLDEMIAETWSAQWTTELLNLLGVLNLVVEMEPVQAELLDRVRSGPLIDRQVLGEANVLPVKKRPTIEKPSKAQTLPLA